MGQFCELRPYDASMTKEVFITPQETPAESELADALRQWGKTHPAAMRGEATKEEEDSAWARRVAAEEAVKREKEAKQAARDERDADRGIEDYAYDIDALADEPND